MYQVYKSMYQFRLSLVPGSKWKITHIFAFAFSKAAVFNKLRP